MNMSVTNLIISSNSCNELNSLNLNEYRYLKSIEIGDDCFENVELFNINALNALNALKIEGDSFTQQKDNWNSIRSDPSRSFHIINCAELESIEIGKHSFSDYGGGFELFNLPKLSTIKMDSFNFSSSSFVIKGIIDMILLMNRSSTFEFH